MLLPDAVLKLTMSWNWCVQSLAAYLLEGFPRKASSSTLIDDGIPDWENLPHWCEGNEKAIEINKKLKAQRGAD